ncbi:MAG: sulfite exporter TauE/SafE family protein [Silicimonas sp.]|nr:sulfite exporter TauE/SafE family protein [Silicimonas sp.]
MVRVHKWTNWGFRAESIFRSTSPGSGRISERVEYWGIILAALGLALGGVLKGAVGAGAPVIAVPIIALVYNVPIAVAVFTLPNLFSNLWQSWHYKAHLHSPRLVWKFSGAGMLGVVVGSYLLSALDAETLMAGLGGVVFVYIGLRFLRPNWILERTLAEKFAVPVGVAGGVMQGAGGISAPVSLTYVNAMRLEREEFIVTVSIFFGAMAVVQIPALIALGIMTPELMGWSLAGSVPLFGAMPFGAMLGRRFPKVVFDRLILILLAVIALQLLWVALR